MNNNHFKAGDSVYCHTELFEIYTDDPVYIKGKTYKILKIENRLPFSSEYSDKYVCFTLQGEYDMLTRFWMTVEDKYFNLIQMTAYLFDDHFLSLKEHRMLKLNSLSGV
jgi:hypothetical protein